MSTTRSPVAVLQRPDKPREVIGPLHPPVCLLPFHPSPTASLSVCGLPPSQCVAPTTAPGSRYALRPSKPIFAAPAVCGTPKRRFRAYDPPAAKNANATDIHKARKEQFRRYEAIGNALPIAIVIGLVVLPAVYFYLNISY